MTIQVETKAPFSTHYPHIAHNNHVLCVRCVLVSLTSGYVLMSLLSQSGKASKLALYRSRSSTYSILSYRCGALALFFFFWRFFKISFFEVIK